MGSKQKDINEGKGPVGKRRWTIRSQGEREMRGVMVTMTRMVTITMVTLARLYYCHVTVNELLKIVCVYLFPLVKL